MTNPLDLFTEEQLSKLHRDSLKQIKKEILLEFQLTNEPTIRRNGIEYDKNDILEIFELLQEDLDYYLILNANPLLKQYLKTKDIDILINHPTLLDNIDSPTIKSKTLKLIAEKMQDSVCDFVFLRKNIHHNKFKKLANFISGLPSEAQFMATAKTHEEFEFIVNKTKTSLNDPFQSPTGLYFKKEIGELVKLKIYQRLELLPNHFSHLRKTFAIWCNNNIIVDSLNRENNINRITKPSLKILYNAAQISATIHDAKSNKLLAKKIKDAYYGSRARSSSGRGGGSMALSFIFIVIFMVRLANCVSRSIPNSKSTYNIDLPRQYKKQKYSSKTYKHQTQLKPKSRKLVGYSPQIEHNKFIKSQKVDGITNFVFESDFFPTSFENLAKLIPKAEKKKFENVNGNYTFEFRHKLWKNKSLKSGAKIDFISKPAYAIFSYKDKNADGELYLTTKPSKYRDAKCSISRYSRDGKKLIAQSKFTTRYSKKTKTHHIRFSDQLTQTDVPLYHELGENQIKLTKEDLQIRNKLDTVATAIISAINNIDIIARKQLKEGQVFTASGINLYDLAKNNKGKVSTTLKSGRLKYYITSKINELAYVQIDLDESQIRYVYNRENGLVEYFVFANYLKSVDEIERIEMIF